MKKIVLASGNAGKLREFQQLLSGCGFEVVPQSDFFSENAEEIGLTFVENAIIKARHASLITGLPAIADDSGLAVDALGGAPGIYSARYAGEAASDSNNIDKLLQALNAVPADKRSAQFHCVLVYMRHAEDPTPLICHGIWHGSITHAKSGSAGFGYDPVFFVPEENCTSAQLSRERKQQLSHRGKALSQLIQLLSK